MRVRRRTMVALGVSAVLVGTGAVAVAGNGVSSATPAPASSGATTPTLVAAGVARVTPVAPPATLLKRERGLNNADWKIECGFASSSKDDPIVLPGKPGASHLHDFFGNRSMNAFSTNASLDRKASGCSQLDRSAYWFPALYQNGRKITPVGTLVYYVNRSQLMSTIQPFPVGYRTVFGDSTNTDINKVDGHITWGCGGNTQLGGHVPPQHCPTGYVQIRFQEPNCWDGKTNAAGVVSWPDHVRFSSSGACPKGYYYALPAMRNVTYYKVGTTTGKITLSSAGGSLASIHMDFMNGWDPKRLRDLVNSCLNRGGCNTHFKGTTPAS